MAKADNIRKALYPEYDEEAARRRKERDDKFNR